MMDPLEKWLHRKPKGPAPKRPIKRNVRPKQVSARRRREAPDYARATAEHLREFPNCQIGPVILAAGFQVRCLGVATHVHHTRGRGRFLCDRTTFRSSCSGECHLQWVHASNVADATALGLLLPHQNRV